MSSPTRRRVAILTAVVAGAVAISAGLALAFTAEHPDELTLTEALAAIDGGAVRAAEVNDASRTVTLRLDDGRTVRARYPEGFGVEITDELTRRDASVTATSDGTTPWTSVAGIVILLALFPALAIVARRVNVQSRAVTTTAGAVADVPDARFVDVAGCDEAVADLAEVVEFLHRPERFAAAGAQLPHGFLLVGPPGTGKTLLARAVAGEAGVPFFAMSGSEFVETFVGVGAARVRSLFAKARKHERAIVFIDEIDAVGKARGGGPATGSSDERESTLNQLLVEMDGFAASGVVVLAATNRPDVLDAALLRPGRFDRRIAVPAPDRGARRQILAVHTGDRRLAADVDLAALARRTAGLTGADLAQLANEASLEAARADRSFITAVDFDRALATTMLGRERRSAVLTERDRRITAWHEAGHAVAALLLDAADDPVQVSIVPRGEAGGVTWMAGSDENFVLRSEAEAKLVVALAGRAAEEVLLAGDVTQGAASDLVVATRLATDMVTRFGMSELGTVAVDPYLIAGSDSATEVHAAVRRILDNAAGAARQLIGAQQELVALVAESLLADETIGLDELRALHARQEETKAQGRASHVGIS